MNLISRLFGDGGQPVAESSPAAAAADAAYDKAMAASDSLLKRMHDESTSDDAARAVMATLWLHRHNVPFLVTMYESATEMESGLVQRSDDCG